MAKYVDTKELERIWGEWLVARDPLKWDSLALMVYKICDGVSTHFNPKSEDEKTEHVHDATTAILDKINTGKLRFTAGRAPVFNLLTTTAFHHLYSKMNKENRIKRQMEKYKQGISTKLIDVKSNERSQGFLPVCTTDFTTTRPPCQVSISPPKPKRPKKKDDRYKYIHTRYPQVIPGSCTFDAQKKKVRCTIKCKKCQKHRRTYTSDLFQVRLCRTCQMEKKTCRPQR